MNRRVVAVVFAVLVFAVPAVHATTGLGSFLQSGPSEPELVYEGEELTLSATSNASIRGTVPQDAGTELRVRLQSTNSSQPFIKQQPTTVTADGVFTASFDLSMLTEDASFTVRVLDATGKELVNASGRIVEPANGWHENSSGGGADPGNADSTATEQTWGTDPDALLTTDAVRDSLRLEPAAGQVVTGTSNLEPGSEVTVRLRSSGSSPFIHSRTTTVDSNGAFDASFNLSHAPSGAPLRATVRHNGSVLTEATGLVRHPNPHVEFDTDDGISVSATDNQTIAGDSNLPAGSDLVIRVQSESPPFVKQRLVSVGENGTFTVDFDFSTVDAGTEFEIAVFHTDDAILITSGTVVDDDT